MYKVNCSVTAKQGIQVAYAIVSEIFNYTVAMIIMQSICIISFIQAITQGKTAYDVSLFDGSKMFLTFSTIALCLVMCNTCVQLMCEKINYFALHIFVILLCYIATLFYGKNTANPYSTINLNVIACVLLALCISKEVLRILCYINWNKTKKEN